MPSTWTILSSGSIDAPNRRSAVCQPSTATGRDVSTSIGLISRPRSASKVVKLTYSGVTPYIRVLSIDLSR